MGKNYRACITGMKAGLACVRRIHKDHLQDLCTECLEQVSRWPNEQDWLINIVFGQLLSDASCKAIASHVKVLQSMITLNDDRQKIEAFICILT